MTFPLFACQPWFPLRRHLTYEHTGRNLVLPIYTKRHVRPPVVVPFHKQIHGITLAHYDCLKLWQLALNLAVQPLQLVVDLWMSDACYDLLYSKLGQSFLKDRWPLLLYLRGVGVELETVISQYGCRLSMIPDGLLQYCKGVLRSGMIRDAVSCNEA